MLRFFLYNQGTPKNHFYTVHSRNPHKIQQEVEDLTNKEIVPLYMTPTPFIFMFCNYGTNKYFGDIPLGSVLELEVKLVKCEK